jgi:hypothetical protein
MKPPAHLVQLIVQSKFRTRGLPELVRCVRVLCGSRPQQVDDLKNKTWHSHSRCHAWEYEWDE